jgi:cation diffusion facilitator family transporter
VTTHAAAPASAHTRLAALSLAVAVVLLAVKSYAWLLTGSQAIFSDAAESIVNVVAAAFAFRVLAWAGQPADREHPFGHGKIEFFSAAFEGGLVVAAALAILWQATDALIDGSKPQQLDVGLILTFGAGLANGALGWLLVRHGRKHHSAAIEADGHHVLSDFVTSLGVVVGLLAVYATDIWWLDPAIAGLMGLWLLRTGWRLVRTSVGALLDEEDPAFVQRLVAMLEPHVRGGFIRIHQLRAIRAGRFHHISAHLVVPEFWTVQRAHAAADALAAKVLAEVEREGDIDFHTDPCDRKYCAACDLADCPVRAAAFVARPPLSVEEAVAPDPASHDLRA